MYPHSLSRVSAARLKKTWIFGYPQSAKQCLGSVCAFAQADRRHRWEDIRNCRKCCVPVQLHYFQKTNILIGASGKVGLTVVQHVALDRGHVKDNVVSKANVAVKTFRLRLVAQIVCVLVSSLLFSFLIMSYLSSIGTGYQ